MQGWPELSCCCPALKDEKHHADWKAADADAVVCLSVADAVVCLSVAGEHPGLHAGGRSLERACRIAMQRTVSWLSLLSHNLVMEQNS